MRILPTEMLELRLRRNKPLSYVTTKGRIDSALIVTDELFEESLERATDRSLYAITEKLVNGFLPLRGGLRVGIAGEGVADAERIKNVKNITSLVYRIPHQIKGVANFLRIDGYFSQNILIVSPPGCGKTTLLRDMARQLSLAGKNVVVLDERGELGGNIKTDFCLDLGPHTDVLVGFPKVVAYENALRALNPDYIVTDEISGQNDVKGVLRAFYGGVKIAATLHGFERNSLFGDFEPLSKVFDRMIVLSDRPRVGTVVKDIAL